MAVTTARPAPAGHVDHVDRTDQIASGGPTR
jgi:hypothetical protein